ncbi:hypothetical protein C8J57DRAFT_1485865 [Mycena rebaudengoi]|nr:hypothetical protein C8J57DRAFT_1485865 [Mycena rebaudengoi]
MSAAADDSDDDEIAMWQAERAVQLARRGDLTGPDTNEGPPDGADPQNPQEAGALRRSREEMEGTQLNLLHLLPAAPFALEEARAWKRTKHLSAESDADAEKFLLTTHPMQHQFMVYTAVLICRDKLTAMEAEDAQNYKPSDSLKKTLVDYGHMVILSPSAPRYRDTAENVSTLVQEAMAAMRLIPIAELPAACETGRTDACGAIMGKAMTDKRCHLKTSIEKTLPEPPAVTDGEKAGKDSVKPVARDIASLTRACIAKTPIKPTAEMYQRVAFIRHCAVKFAKSGKTDADFWPDVDNRLIKYRKAWADKEAEQSFWKRLYDKDKLIYGEPDSKFPVTAVGSVDKWLRDFNKDMEN